jgi:hypothetical protein
VLSLDNLENKHVIGCILMDRIILMQRVQRKKVFSTELKVRAFNPMDCLLNSYL